MLKYILQRIMAFVPTLIFISLLAFVVSVSAPGDPVERLLRAADSEGSTSEQAATVEQERQKLRRQLGLDRPLFYVTVGTLAKPDTLYRIGDRTERVALSKLTNRHGNWSAVSDYYFALYAARIAHEAIDVSAIVEASREQHIVEKQDTLGNVYIDTVMRAALDKNTVQEATNQSNITYVGLLQTDDDEEIRARFVGLQELYDTTAYMAPVMASFTAAKEAYDNILSSRTPWKSYIPKPQMHGFFNQYHLWLFGDVPYLKKNPKPGVRVRRGVLRGDFGVSYHDGQPISNKIGQRVFWSMLLAMIGIIAAYVVSVPIGIYSAYKRNQPFDRISAVLLFILYSLPTFFVGTWLLVMFANPDNFVWFPEGGIMDPSSFDPSTASFWEHVEHRAPFFILPLITYTYGSLAYLSRIMRVGMVEVFGQDYIRTARAKGLSERTVVMKHALRNSLIPIITVFASIFPAAIGGSVVIEMIFSYPGMGVMILEAVVNQDYPVIITVFSILGFFTMIGYLVSDVLYGVVDPRISYK